MRQQEWVNPDELEAVLHELHADELRQRLQHEEPDEDELHQDDVTVAAISEVTGTDPETIMRILQEVRRDRREEELAHRLAKMEEPIYRVERPAPDNVAKATSLDAAFAKRHTVNTTLSDLERREVRRIKINVKERLRKLKDQEAKEQELKTAEQARKGEVIGMVLFSLMIVVSLIAFLMAFASSGIR